MKQVINFEEGEFKGFKVENSRLVELNNGENFYKVRVKTKGYTKLSIDARKTKAPFKASFKSKNGVKTELVNKPKILEVELPKESNLIEISIKTSSEYKDSVIIDNISISKEDKETSNRVKSLKDNKKAIGVISFALIFIILGAFVLIPLDDSNIKSSENSTLEENISVDLLKLVVEGEYKEESEEDFEENVRVGVDLNYDGSGKVTATVISPGTADSIRIEGCGDQDTTPSTAGSTASVSGCNSGNRVAVIGILGEKRSIVSDFEVP